MDSHSSLTLANRDYPAEMKIDYSFNAFLIEAISALYFNLVVGVQHNGTDDSL
ncbi:MAG: hypothetical protein KAG53_11620 [Endozoicomonadaceae bacterium]|nr:hypothetical protein [Endozoicomonadaceae bacterium]